MSATPIAVMESDIGSIAADSLSPWIYWVSDSVGVYRAAK